MKNRINISKLLLCLVGFITFISCEKDELLTQNTIVNEQEGFMGGNDQSNIIVSNEYNNDEGLDEPLLYMSFDKGVSRTEALTKFKQAQIEYMHNNPSQSKGVSTDWYYMIETLTGLQKNNGTDARVEAAVNFKTNVKRVSKKVVLNNKGDDREGGWDIYLFRASVPKHAVKWVEVLGGTLYLRGTDGWFVKEYHISLLSKYQTVTATGKSEALYTINNWLDNSRSGQWAFFLLPDRGVGRLTF